MPKARVLYAGEDLGLELENTVYALDYLGLASHCGLPSAGVLPMVGSTTINHFVESPPLARLSEYQSRVQLILENLGDSWYIQCCCGSIQPFLRYGRTIQ